MTTDRPVRHRCELMARLERAGAAPLKVTVLDLSEHGAFIEECEGLNELQVGDATSLTIALPGGNWQSAALVSRLGTNRRDVKHPSVEHVTVAAPGFGLEFEGLKDDALEQLRDYLELLDER
jgi:hypothetical protein